MLIGHNTGGFAATSAPNGFDLDDFEKAGLRVAERRFAPKDTIFTPGDPDDQLYFLLSGAVRLYKLYGDYKEPPPPSSKTAESSASSTWSRGAGRTCSPRP
jgi:CRP/FNR family transcriptional regulator, global nitrogen regulator